jgi:ferredoxin--NADP+ reductase
MFTHSVCGPSCAGKAHAAWTESFYGKIGLQAVSKQSQMNPESLAEKATPETVTQVLRWTDKLFSITTTRPAEYSFTPGQYARLGLQDEHGMVWRAYSIVSSPSEDALEYYGVLVPGGAFTTRLADIMPGDTLWTDRQRFGVMTADRFVDGDDLWMLATGTGLGPFISILRDGAVWKRFKRLVLVHCVRHAEEFCYAEELRGMQAMPPAGATATLTLVQSATRDAPCEQHPGRLNARITTLLENGRLEQAAGIPLTVEASRIMLCGNPEMIEDTRRLLHHRGMRPCRRLLPGQFVTENYW